MSGSDWSSDFTEDEDDCDFSIVDGQQSELKNASTAPVSVSNSLSNQLQAKSTTNDYMYSKRTEERVECNQTRGLGGTDDCETSVSPNVKLNVEPLFEPVTSFPCEHCGVTFSKKAAMQLHLENFVCQPHLWLREDDSESEDSDGQSKVDMTRVERPLDDVVLSLEKYVPSDRETKVAVDSEETYGRECSPKYTFVELPSSNQVYGERDALRCNYCESTFQHKSAFDHHMEYFICRPHLWLKEETEVSSSDESAKVDVAKKTNAIKKTAGEKDEFMDGGLATLRPASKRSKHLPFDFNTDLVCSHCKITFRNRFAFKNHLKTLACRTTPGSSGRKMDREYALSKMKKENRRRD